MARRAKEGRASARGAWPSPAFKPGLHGAFKPGLHGAFKPGPHRALKPGLHRALKPELHRVRRRASVLG
jgi:hypothetical protein